MILTPRTAMTIAVSMLAATLVWSKCETRTLPADRIPLQRVPMALGQWTCIEESANPNYGAEVATLERTYRDAAGNKASVILQGTYTRLGALRDWSLARTTGGWTVASQSQVSLTLPSAGQSVVMTVQDMRSDTSNEVAVTWYASSQRQAATLARAEMAAWADRLAGRRLPWLSQYITVTVPRTQDRVAAQERALDLAQRMAAALRAVASSSS